MEIHVHNFYFLTLIPEFYANVDPKIRHPKPMNYRVFFHNKTVDISTQRIKNSLSITIKNVQFQLELYIISNENFLIEISHSPNVSHNAKQLYIPGYEFTLFYLVLKKMVCVNLLPSKYSFDWVPTR